MFSQHFVVLTADGRKRNQIMYSLFAKRITISLLTCLPLHQLREKQKEFKDIISKGYFLRQVKYYLFRVLVLNNFTSNINSIPPYKCKE